MLPNTVPVRVPLPAGARVIDWLREIAERNAAARAHDMAALPDVARWSGLPQGTPLFTTLFDYQRPGLQGALSGLGESWAGRSFRLHQHPGYPLTVGVSGESPLRVEIGYDADLFDAAAVDRMLGHFARLMAEMAAGPGRLLGELDPLDEAERRRVVVEWNRTGAEYPAGVCIHRLFEAQAARTPDAAALVCGGESLSYRELDERAGRLARHLRLRGVGPETRVGICLERSLELGISVLAVLKAGGAYVPLDPSYPAERLRYMLRDSAAPVLLTRERVRDALGVPPGVEVVALDTPHPPAPSPTRGEGEHDDAADEGALSHSRTFALSHSPSPDSLAYAIYTSGSTGRPKGVMVTHGAAVNFLHAMRERPGISPDDTLLAVTTLAFDISLLELLLPLTVGARVVLADRETAADPVALADLLASSGATVMQATPATWKMLVFAGWEGDRSLRVLSGGEALPGAIADLLRERGLDLWNLYGPTETTVWSTVHPVDRSEPVVPVGTPVANTRAYVLDAHLEPVPAG
ncbi:MAG TPA: AMP-binding protein, partial [Longimicrobiaceae bacterium]|nr:AMP-binding protein [Longimicrobiaceae bacterium]